MHVQKNYRSDFLNVGAVWCCVLMPKFCRKKYVSTFGVEGSMSVTTWGQTEKTHREKKKKKNLHKIMAVE
jgi:hypothetical protein